MKYFSEIKGVPDFEAYEYSKKKRKDYCLLIPVLNEGNRIKAELHRAMRYDVASKVDIIICDGDSKDGSMNGDILKSLGVRNLLVKKGPGRQGAQLRMGIYYALLKDYKGVITVDGNNKDSLEHVGRFIDKLDAGFDFVQGSRFIKGGHAIRTPLCRLLAVRLIHAPFISFTAGEKFTDTTNNYRGYSRDYLENEMVKPLRDVFDGYELLAYMSVRASQIGLKTCEVPVDRVYPMSGATPTKISGIKGNMNLMKILIFNALGMYNPR